MESNRDGSLMTSEPEFMTLSTISQFLPVKKKKTNKLYFFPKTLKPEILILMYHRVISLANYIFKQPRNPKFRQSGIHLCH